MDKEGARELEGGREEGREGGYGWRGSKGASGRR